ncbi:MAG: phosphoribosylformylglycinamidine synthase [Candidatus Spyradocola sp.]|nr:phosphoribosylformylglycinamidine synthase [Candidatus Spyradocola sp.]
MAINRIYVEKRPEHAVEAGAVLSDLRQVQGIAALRGVRIFNRYDVEGLTDEQFASAVRNVLSEPQLDFTYEHLPPRTKGERTLAVEFLPGQFDQRADSAAQCIQFQTCGERPTVRSARVYMFDGEITDEQMAVIKKTLINPVEAREASLDRPETLKVDYEIPTTVKVLTGFNALDAAGLAAFVKEYGLAMDEDDIAFCQNYFKNEEHRDPTITEIRMIDTYWSDHCRHTTFLTEIDDADIEYEAVQDTYNKYLDIRSTLYAGRTDKPITLMDIATIGAKALKKAGMLRDLDESEEINACSVRIPVDVDGEVQDWVLMFKNETHNHPTEIEPFGGAATCLGGAIRDPLSGRSYVYQAMRVTGSGDPTVPFDQTREGKLPQRKLTTTAAAGYSAYGNQIGLATGHVAEVYDEGYVAKRLEIGAVLGAAPYENIRRDVPRPGDKIVLLGGATGRDGCGGATGSSKSHTVESLSTCGAEVQKGNPPEERKLQRLFRDPEVTRMILRCNDFGAGGVSVAIGELADGLTIDLNAVPRKYDGLDGTELAISESQERMACVIAPEDVDKFIAAANKENLSAVVVAVVEKQPRLTMNWNGVSIVSISREFLNSNGASKHTTVKVENPTHPAKTLEALDFPTRMQQLVSNLNVCSQKGLVERFDSTIGANTVLMPFGGERQLSPSQAMAAKIPVLGGETTTCSLMGWGFNPVIAKADPYKGAMTAVIESVSKIVAAGGSYKRCWMTFQEYFERTKGQALRWGKPFQALLGALEAQLQLGIASIGGKDSMSGSFEDLDVPPTLVSFAVSTTHTDHVVSTEFKSAGSKVALLRAAVKENGLPDFESVKAVYERVEQLIDEGKVKSAWVVGFGGVAEGVFKMGLGNRLGFAFSEKLDDETLYAPAAASFLLEMDEVPADLTCIGEVTADYALTHDGERADMAALQAGWEAKLQGVFPYLTPSRDDVVTSYRATGERLSAPRPIAKPRVLIPVFPGTNCEYDTARAFERAGAQADILVIRNRTAQDIEESIAAFVEKANASQIIALPGGFSGGDEPEGSAKFITSFLRNPQCTDAVHELLHARDGLMLGICNGFQALIKLGLVPFGRIVETDHSCPTLTFNAIGRHQSMLVRTRVASNKSPWLMHMNVGDVHTVAISHGEGRFVADEKMLRRLALGGQIATQYVDLQDQPTLNVRFNPNLSVDAIEGITSPDGRVLGKMAHSERMGDGLYENVPGNKFQDIFRGAVDYFTL